jgi:small redox-active disulfide protein 2
MKEFIMLIKILGSGCAKCNRLEQLTRDAVAELGLAATFEHVKEMDRIMAYPIMTTPALVINEEVKVAGRMPGKDELLAWLKAAA